MSTFAGQTIDALAPELYKWEIAMRKMNSLIILSMDIIIHAFLGDTTPVSYRRVLTAVRNKFNTNLY